MQTASAADSASNIADSSDALLDLVEDRRLIVAAEWGRVDLGIESPPKRKRFVVDVADLVPGPIEFEDR